MDMANKMKIVNTHIILRDTVNANIGGLFIYLFFPYFKKVLAGDPVSPPVSAANRHFISH